MQHQRFGLGLLGLASLSLAIGACEPAGDSSESGGSGGGDTGESTTANNERHHGHGQTGTTSTSSGTTTSTSSGTTTSTSSGTTTSTSSGTTTSTSTSTGTGTGSPSGQWVLGYYVGYQINDYPIAQIDWSALTHIAFAGITVNNDLTLDLSFFDQNGTGIQDAKALSAAAHAHGVKALLLLGGQGAGPNIAVAASPAHRAAFVTSLISAMETLGYDGIDLDWEENITMDDLVALAQALRAARPNIQLSYPAGMINGNYQSVDPKLATLAQSIDQFNIQSYYPSTALSGYGWNSWFNSPLSGAAGSTPAAIDDTLQRYVAAGIPKSKLGLGMSFYAICYTGGITAPRQPTDGATQQIVGGDNAYPLRLLFAGGGRLDQTTAAERKVDVAAQVPYLSLGTAVYDQGCGASTRYISYEDEASILAKGAFSKSHGYGGAMVWTIQQGWLSPGAAGGRPQNALMQALKKGFLDP
jgi:chitinase